MRPILVNLPAKALFFAALILAAAGFVRELILRRRDPSRPFSSTPLYLLIGGDRVALQSGKRLTVVGTPQPGLMSTCQQGTPFQVTAVRG